VPKSNARLNQLKNKPLREQVLEALRDAIVQGDFQPGQSMVEAELASQLGVSRAPVREALQILHTEGLVEIEPYHGTVVRRLDKTDIEELYSLRSVLEVFAIRRIVALKNAESVNILRDYYTRMLEAANQEDLKQVNEIDRGFHDALITLSEHQLLLSTWNTVGLRVRQIMALLNMRNADLKQIAYNHLPIVEAISGWDVEKAVLAIQEHVAASGELIAEGWAQNGSDEEDA
jgi:DNA-binding GntR family transcriptional regulator